MPRPSIMPGVYTSPITLNDNTFDVEVTVDEDHINSISLKNLSETTTAMYPLMEPALEVPSPLRSVNPNPQKTLPTPKKTNIPPCCF